MKKTWIVLFALVAGFGSLAAFAADTAPPQVTAVFESYARIQAALAQDSIQGISKEAGAIANAINGDASKSFAASVGPQAEVLGKAADLKTARTAFKALSASLIDYAAKHHALGGTYKQVHCPMVNADWLQKEFAVKNPYFGKAMLQCGEFVKP